MSATNALENDLLALLFNNTAAPNIGNAGGLQPSSVAGVFEISLHNADPGEAADQTTHETAYTNYTRIAVNRDASWTVSGTAPTKVVNASPITFPTCGVTGDTLTHFGIGSAHTLAGHLFIYSQLTSPLVVTNGVTPTFAAGQLQVTLD